MYIFHCLVVVTEHGHYSPFGITPPPAYNNYSRLEHLLTIQRQGLIRQLHIIHRTTQNLSTFIQKLAAQNRRVLRHLIPTIIIAAIMEIAQMMTTESQDVKLKV